MVGNESLFSELSPAAPVGMRFRASGVACLDATFCSIDHRFRSYDPFDFDFSKLPTFLERAKPDRT